jgi:DNA-binding transcriptional ArsR family regulator
MKEKAYKLFFGTLANKNRLKIINLLRKSPKCVNEITKELNFNQTTVSHNLKRLQRCGFVFVERKGKHRFYKLNKKTIKPLMEMIDNHMREFCEKLVKNIKPKYEDD